MKISRRPADIIKVGLLLIFLLSVPVLGWQMPDHLIGPITSDEIAIDLPPSEESFFNPASRDIISRQRERALMDRANLSAKLENLSAAHSQKSSSIVRSPSEGSINGSNPDLEEWNQSSAGYLENRLDITVKGISVRAINTVEGGKATATSNIIIEPVQIIKLAPPAAEKLR